MSTLNLELLVTHIKRRQASRGLRAVAGEIGVSPATLSRVENGKAPDLENFSKICHWLGTDPAIYLGVSTRPRQTASESPNLIRVQLDVVLDVPGERAGPLMDVSLVDALVTGLRARGVKVEGASRGWRSLQSVELGKALPRRLRERKAS
jgi:transcriptional regulator with XRE-family HTH domain